MTPLVPGTGIEEVRKHSTWFLVIGVALVIVGMIAIGSAVAMTIASVIFFGWLLIIGGVFEVIHSFTRRDRARLLAPTYKSLRCLGCFAG